MSAPSRRSHRSGLVAWIAAALVMTLITPAEAQVSSGPSANPEAQTGSSCVPAAPTGCTLRELAPAAGIRVGAVLSPTQIDEPDYARTLSSEFSALTAENAMKWYSVESTRGVLDFSGADAVLQFAEDHDMEVRGHNLVWAQDQFTQQWIKDLTDPNELRGVLYDHIDAVLGRYAGRIRRWDVVNEPLATTGAGLSDSVFGRVLGPDWLADVYRHAHEVDPTAELWLNEFGADWVPGKHQALLTLVKGLLDDGVPLDGIGLQTHRLSVDGPDRLVFEQQLRDYAALGLRVALTEVDVAVRPGDSTGLARQAEAYATIFSACLAVPACEEVTMWGVTDAATWLDSQGILPAPT